MEAQRVDSFPNEALEHVLSFISSDEDRNSVSLVSKFWYEIERRNRRHVFISNSYAAAPQILIKRFPNVKSITIKGRHKLCGPIGWSAAALPWITAVVEAYPTVEEIKLKRMTVTNEDLELIGRNLKFLRVLDLSLCEGYSGRGLEFIASNLRYLKSLELYRVEEYRVIGASWLKHFRHSSSSLESLDLYALNHSPSLSTLELLLLRFPNMKKLHLNPEFPLEILIKILPMAPQLEELGTGFYTKPFATPIPNIMADLTAAFEGCKKLTRLSRLWGLDPDFLPAIYPICAGLTFLDLKYTAQNHYPEIGHVLSRCPNLQRLHISNFIADEDLAVVGETCKELQVLKVYLMGGVRCQYINVTELGFLSIALGCPKLRKIVFFCMRMTNEAMVLASYNMPNLVSLDIQTFVPRSSDAVTGKPLDDGYIAILQNCSALRRLKIGGLTTDNLLIKIGALGGRLETIHISYGNGGDYGYKYMLSGCRNLRKLSMVGCFFHGLALLGKSGMLERMRSIWMVNCPMYRSVCEYFVGENPRVNVEVMKEALMPGAENEERVEKIYVYRALAGPRKDYDAFIWSANEHMRRRLGDLGLD